jgi:hypothetical protein
MSACSPADAERGQGLSTKRGKGQESDPLRRCSSPAKGVRFRLPDGRLIPVPCGRASCPACSRHRAFIAASMFGIDAAVATPQVAMTTTTRDEVTAAELREGQAQMLRRIRADLAPEARYCAIVEWTTGAGTNSGGRRRPHFHSLWKSLPVDAADDARAIASDVWKRIAGAHSAKCERIRTPGGAVAYVARHHFKVSQAPPIGWSGKRVRPCKGWWELGAQQTRERAIAAVRDGRLRWLIERELIDAIPEVEGGNAVMDDVWDELVTRQLEERARERVQLVKVRERETIDMETGEVRRRLVKVLGDVE